MLFKDNPFVIRLLTLVIKKTPTLDAGVFLSYQELSYLTTSPLRAE